MIEGTDLSGQRIAQDKLGIDTDRDIALLTASVALMFSERSSVGSSGLPLVLRLAALLVLLLFGLVRTTAAAPGRSAPPPSVRWQAATREDVIAAYELFRRHHPGMFDPQNRGSPEQLRRSRDIALRFARKVDDAEGHMRALAVFSAALADGHARVQASYSGQGTPLWPGFRTVWRGEALYVVGPVDDGPPQSSVLLGCDGEDALAIIRKGAFQFYGLPEQAGQWWQFAPQTFLRDRSKYDRLPRRCSFRSPDGRLTDYPLRWRPVPEEEMLAWRKNSEREPVGLNEPRPGIWFVSLSTFSPDMGGVTRYGQLFRELDNNVAAIAAAKALVLDLRGNRGGSSSWSKEVAEHLWGEAAVKAKLAEYFRNTEVWWRADAENVDHFRQVAVALRAQDRDSNVQDLEILIGHLSDMIAQGQSIYVEEFGRSLQTDRKSAVPRRLPPVYVITDGSCASACLDAIYTFTRFPGVKLVGAPTLAQLELSRRSISISTVRPATASSSAARWIATACGAVSVRVMFAIGRDASRSTRSPLTNDRRSVTATRSSSRSVVFS